MNLGDVTVKNFGEKSDYLIRIEATNNSDENFINSVNQINFLILTLQSLI